jgi:hypothetical protein
MKMPKDGVIAEFIVSATLRNDEDQAAWDALTRQVRDACALPKYDNIKPEFT